MRIAIVGFGLIGGSIARGLARPGAAASLAGPVDLAAWSLTSAGTRAALADGVIGRAPATLGETVDGADLVVLAAPPLDCLDLLDELGGALVGALAAGATITDVASTKAVVIERADRLGLRFVGGHPMAGRDATGYAAAEADLFVDRPWVVCPGANAAPSDVDRVERLARATGAHPIRLAPAAHDRAVAAISHAPLVVSAALVEAMTGRPDWPLARSLAAGGWRDMTRLAGGAPDMGTGIAATNGPEIAAAV
ncbi:MAG TPA: prephenate dehydrogenase/arogenate dehydrogenase family protein, partial [Patescibacteria group bacterium]|nr:prephenate dehydrogenase/arogenate dehydrogenase family protein [Patescibacteria group bacterium]